MNEEGDASILSFSEDSKYWDISFEVEDKVVYGNKAVLCMSSRVFKTMLEGRFKEANMKHIPLPGKKYEDIIEFMKIIHPPWRKFTGKQNDFTVFTHFKKG